MKSHDPSSSRPDPDPERLLRARLRETTPEFEARFDALHRRLAHEPRPSAWFTRPSWLVRPAGRFGLGVTAVAVLVVAVWLVRPGPDSAARAAAAYGDLVVLDDTLHDALPLIDAEIIETLLLMPSDFGT